jgi:hypothetical protein
LDGHRQNGCDGPLGGFLDFTGANAGCADADAAADAVHQRSHRLQIQVPTAIGDIVGVAYAVSELGASTANFTNSCHETEISLDLLRNDYSNRRE